MDDDLEFTMDDDSEFPMPLNFNVTMLEILRRKLKIEGPFHVNPMLTLGWSKKDLALLEGSKKAKTDDESVDDKEIKAVEDKAATKPGDKVVGEFLVKIPEREVDSSYLKPVHKLCKNYLSAKGRRFDVTVEMLNEVNYRLNLRRLLINLA